MRTRRAVALAAIGAVPLGGVVGGASVALAGSVWGPWSDVFTVNGVSYKDRNWISTAPGSSSEAETYLSAGSSVVTGHLGALARLYVDYGNGNIVLCRQSAWQYNPVAGTAMAAVIQPGCGPNLPYKSEGQVRVWNGSGYNTYDTPASPYQNS